MGAAEALSVDEALRAMTMHAAWQLGVEEQRGSFEPGKAADLVMLSGNPMRTAPEDLAVIEVLGTWIDGQPVDARKVSPPNQDLALQTLWQLATR